jgi:IPT/TIG domain
MRIDSILPSQVSPGQTVIIQGEGLEASEKVLLGEDVVPFEVDGETVLVSIPDISGPIDVTVQSGDGQNDTATITVQ